MAHETVKLLANDDLAMIPIRLYLQGVSYLQNCNYDGAVDLCYEFFTQVIFSDFFVIFFSKIDFRHLFFMKKRFLIVKNKFGHFNFFREHF